MKKSIFSKTATIVAALCLLLKAEVSNAKSSFPLDKFHQDSQLVSDWETLLAGRPRRPPTDWVNRVPTRSVDTWVDRERGIYRSRTGSIIGSYRALREVMSQRQRPAWLPQSLKRPGVQAHHLIEKRFARVFRLNENDIPSVLLPQDQHTRRGGIHSMINSLIPHGNRRDGSRSYNTAQILRAYQQVYADRPDWLDAITAIMSEWHNP